MNKDKCDKERDKIFYYHFTDKLENAKLKFRSLLNNYKPNSKKCQYKLNYYNMKIRYYVFMLEKLGYLKRMQAFYDVPIIKHSNDDEKLSSCFEIL